MTNRKRLWLIAIPALLVAGFVVLWGSVFWRWYSAEPLQATVVDAETKKPLAGVAVVAAWELKGGLNTGQVVGYVNILETTTDEQGRFSFPAWGPKLATSGVVRLGAPVLLLFKPGYDYSIRDNDGPLEQNAQSPLRSKWNGRTIELQEFKGTIQEHARSLASLESPKIAYLERFGDGARSVRKFLCAVRRQAEELSRQGAESVFPSQRWLEDRGVECVR